ncbi:MAG: DUF3237 domain-containing protein [Caulobacteraceae bacterium]
MTSGTKGAATRRTVLAAGAATPVSALAAAPSGLTGETPGVEFVYEAIADLSPALTLGQTPFGMRRQVPILGGTFAGPRIKGTILAGGIDWQLIRPDGFTTIEATYTIQTHDNVLIHVRNHGVIRGLDKAPPERYGRTIPEFEAPNGAYGWLNEAVFVGALGLNPGSKSQVKIGIFRVT